MSQGLVEGVARGNAVLPESPKPAASTPAANAPGDEEFVTGRDLNVMRQQATDVLSQVARQNAQTAYGIAKREHAAIFKKYEPEIAQVLGRFPQEQWSLDVIEKAVTFVKGNHVDELAEEKARSLVAQMEPTIRSTGSGGSASVPKPTTELSLDSEKIPARWREHAKAVGISEREVQEMCMMQGISPEEFWAQFKDGLVTDAVAEVSWKRTG